jgi:uncharacterized protein involved in response to NO
VITLLGIEEPVRPRRRGFALWQLGLRPFYMLASSFAALSIPLWALQYSGIFTAGRNWSKQPTPTDPALAALVLLWVAARVLALTPWGWAAAASSIGFALAVAQALARPLWAACNRRNYIFVSLLRLLAVAALGMHLQLPGVFALPPGAGMTLIVSVALTKQPLGLLAGWGCAR